MPPLTPDEVRLREEIQRSIQQQNIKRVFEELSSWQRTGRPLTSYCFQEILRAIKHICSFDPNALQYIEMVVKRMNKSSATLNPATLSMLVRTLGSSKRPAFSRHVV